MSDSATTVIIADIRPPVIDRLGLMLLIIIAVATFLSSLRTPAAPLCREVTPALNSEVTK